MEINLFTFQVGPNYGRKMMSGYVRSKGLTLGSFSIDDGNGNDNDNATN